MASEIVRSGVTAPQALLSVLIAAIFLFAVIVVLCITVLVMYKPAGDRYEIREVAESSSVQQLFEGTS